MTKLQVWCHGAINGCVQIPLVISEELAVRTAGFFNLFVPVS